MQNLEKKSIGNNADGFISQALTSTRSISEMMYVFFKEKKHFVWSLLPIDLNEDIIIKFQYGYIHKNHPKLEDHIRIFKQLMDSNDKYEWILIDNESESDVIPEENSIESITKVFYFEETVFHLLPKDLVTINNLDITIRSAGWYPSIVLITELSSKLLHRIEENNLEVTDVEEIIKNTKYLIIGAYDEEGFLIVEFE